MDLCHLDLLLRAVMPMSLLERRGIEVKSKESRSAQSCWGESCKLQLHPPTKCMARCSMFHGSRGPTRKQIVRPSSSCRYRLSTQCTLAWHDLFKEIIHKRPYMFFPDAETTNCRRG